MTKKYSSLPREVSALIHHVELNRVGWWDKTLNRLILATIWLEEGNPDVREIQNAIQATFGLSIDLEKLDTLISILEDEGDLVRVAEDKVHIPEKVRIAFEQEISDAEVIEDNARQYFYSIAEKSCPDIEIGRLWGAFQNDVLIPLVQDVGAHTYHLIAGERMVLNGAYVEHFMVQFGEQNRAALKDIITTFLDPKNSNVRSFMTRMLHAYFCVQASGVSEEVLEKLKANTDKPLKFRLFVDTNFLFSLLGLHENPSNASARELKALLLMLKDNPRVDLVVTPRTITEAKRAIGSAKTQMAAIPASSNFTDVALRAGLSGMGERFLSERKLRNGQLSVSDWFDPYLRDFVPLAREAGVELFNENLDSYGTRQDVIDDIHLIMAYEKRKLPKERQKSYEITAVQDNQHLLITL